MWVINKKFPVVDILPGKEHEFVGNAMSPKAKSSLVYNVNANDECDFGTNVVSLNTACCPSVAALCTSRFSI